MMILVGHANGQSPIADRQQVDAPVKNAWRTFKLGANQNGTSRTIALLGRLGGAGLGGGEGGRGGGAACGVAWIGGGAS
jgi:hypothetical protein